MTTTPEKRFVDSLVPVMDLEYDLSCDVHTPATLARKFSLLASLGFQQVNIVIPPPGQTDYTHAGRRHYQALERDNHLVESESSFENPIRDAIALARQAGLAVHAIFKPYEGGGLFTIPREHRLQPPRSQVPCLGGATSVIPFIAEHPHWRLKRRPEPSAGDQPITRITCQFLLDKLELWQSNGELKAAYEAIGDEQLPEPQGWLAKLYASDDNASYRRLADEPRLTQQVKRVPVRDANGFLRLGRARVLEVELSAFALTAPYHAVKLSHPDFRQVLIPASMVTAWAGDEPLPATVSPTYRYEPSHTDLWAEHPPTAGDFRSSGFEYGWGPMAGYDWREWDTFGIARGHEPYQRGVLCEAIPEVREYWLEELRRLISYGVSGIDIRLLSHASGALDFACYGFNEELRAAFRAKYGREPAVNPQDALAMMRVRGDFFLQFLSAARELLHAHGCSLQAHVRDCYCRPALDPDYHQLGFWAMPKVLPDWRRLLQIVDRVILSDNLSPRQFRGVRRLVEGPIKQVAKRLGKPVWCYLYLQQGGDFNDESLAELAADPAIDGIYLYEVVYNEREDDGILQVLAPDQVRVVPRHQERFQRLLTGGHHD